MRKIKAIVGSLVLAVSFMFMGPGLNVAEAGNICIQCSDDYTYNLNYVDHEGKWDVVGRIVGENALCSGTALVNPAGHIVIGLNTAWAWGTGGYTDPTSVVYMDLTAGTYDITYFGDSSGARNFQGTVSIVPCGTSMETGHRAENNLKE
jgi:hypothetical protein